MKQIGHSAASLYRYASTCWPLTYGATGSWTSWGVRFAVEFDRDEVVNEARVFARPRKSGMEDVVVGEAGPEVG